MTDGVQPAPGSVVHVIATDPAEPEPSRPPAL